MKNKVELHHNKQSQKNRNNWIDKKIFLKLQNGLNKTVKRLSISYFLIISVNEKLNFFSLVASIYNFSVWRFGLKS